MDPITITVTLLSVISLANNVYNTVSRLSKSSTSNNRIKTQRISFKTEKVTLEQWMKNCAMSGTPLEGNAEVQELLHEFATQAEKVTEILSRYSFSSEVSASSAKKFSSRLKYESGGYEELNEMILLMEKLNKALQTIAPPLPPGYTAASGNPGRLAIERSSMYTSASGENSLPTGGMSMSMHSSLSEVTEQEVQQNLAGLCTACRDAFTTMSDFGQQSSHALSGCRDRLKLWETGLFAQGDLHLDSLLGASKAMNEKLAEPLASHFVEIALEQLRAMESILASESGRDTSSLKTASIQMKNFLLAMDMTQPILEDLFYFQIVEQSQSDLPTETLESRVKYLSAMVEMLFAYLPGINRLRISRCLLLERKEHEQLAPAVTPHRETVSSDQGAESQSLEGPIEFVATQTQIKSKRRRVL